MKTNSINFKAHFVTSANIKKLDRNKQKYFPDIANIVMLDAENKNDAAALSKAIKSWKGAIFAENIVAIFRSIEQQVMNGQRFKIFAVTTQQKDFDNLDADKLIAMSEVDYSDNGKKIWLDYIQVKPDTMYSAEEREYKGVGAAFLNYLKELNITTFLTSNHASERFYQKNGFRPSKTSSLDYEWKPEFQEM